MIATRNFRNRTIALIFMLALLLGPSATRAGVQAGPLRAPLPPQVFVPLAINPGLLVSAVLTPFDANAEDLNGPASWLTSYGKAPEIIVASSGTELDVLAQDYNAATPWSAVLLHVAPRPGGGYAITQALTGLPMLDRVMGLAIDAGGNRYYATAVDESDRVDSSYPPPNTTRSNIVRVVRIDQAGAVRWNIDLDPARRAFDNNAEMIINPMTFASARLAVGGNELALVHGINTDPDWNIGGARHQKALSTRLNATTGAITRASSIWVSHSFDQRLIYDGQGIIEQHLGDAYPRQVVFGRDHSAYPLFHIKGTLGDNSTATRLGNLALIENDPTYRYLALFATESTPTTGDSINGPRNLAIVRVNRNDNSIDPNLPDTLTVVSAGAQQTNRLRWLTSYSAAASLHAERPKLVALANNQYAVLWEEWRNQNNSPDTFIGVRGMIIDANGNTIQAAKLLTAAHHLPRGDDAFLLGGRAGWVTGSAPGKRLYIHLVDAALNYTVFTLN